VREDVPGQQRVPLGLRRALAAPRVDEQPVVREELGEGRALAVAPEARLGVYRIVAVHALRNALVPVVTVIGLQVGTLMGGAILTESVFSWPGIGKWLVESIARRDYPALQGGVLVIAALVMAVNLIVDLMYGLLNPRIRHRR